MALPLFMPFSSYSFPCFPDTILHWYQCHFLFKVSIIRWLSSLNSFTSLQVSQRLFQYLSLSSLHTMNSGKACEYNGTFLSKLCNTYRIKVMFSWFWQTQTFWGILFDKSTCSGLKLANLDFPMAASGYSILNNS